MFLFGKVNNPREFWEEEDYCVPPLAQERAGVLDEYFTELEVQHVTKGEGWKQIDALEIIWENNDHST